MSGKDKEMKHRLLIFFLVWMTFHFIACHSPDLKGHWHIQSMDQTETLFTLDFDQDTICIMNINSFWSTLKGYRKKDKIFISTPKGWSGYELSIQNEKLIQIKDILTSEQYKGKRCDEACCNSVDEYLKDLNVDIQMLLVDSLGLINDIPAQYLFLGRPNKYYNEAYGDDILLSINNQFTTNYTLPFVHDNQLERFINIPFIYKIIADKETTLAQILGIKTELNKIGVEEIFIATSFEKQEKNDFRYILVNELDFKNPQMKWGTYLTLGK